MDNPLSILFYEYGKTILNDFGNSTIVGIRRFKAAFGVSPNICSMVWQMIKTDLTQDFKEIHLLWTLFFLKCYNTESVNRSIFKCDEKTYRVRVWRVIESLAFLKVVRWFGHLFILHVIISFLSKVKWENRKHNSVQGQTCFTSLDGVDFKINEPSPFNPSYYSHKFKSAGLRYEIGLCLRTGEIVWAHGGFPCGAYPDLKIAKDLFIQFLDENEKTMADKGYNDRNYFILPNEQNNVRHKKIMSRHETVNKRIRHFNVLNNKFRHDKSLHGKCFHAIVNLSQIIIKNEDPLFSVV